MNLTDIKTRLSAALTPAAPKPTAAEARYSEFVAETSRRRELAAERRKLAKPASDAAERVRYLESLRFASNNELRGLQADPDYYAIRIQDATARREALEGDIVEAAAHRDTLNARLAELTETAAPAVTPETIAEHAKRLRVLSGEVEHLEARRDEIAAEPVEGGEDPPETIRELRETLAAAEALGRSKPDELTELRKALAEAEAKERERDAKRQHQAETLAGLDRRILAAQGALGAARALTPALVVGWARGEALGAAERFHVDAEKARKHLLRCRALQALARQHGGDAQAPGSDILEGLTGAPLTAALISAQAAEAERLRALGIEV